MELIQVLQNLQKRSIAFAIPVWNGFQSEGLDPGQGDFQVKNNQSRLGDACVPVMCVCERGEMIPPRAQLCPRSCSNKHIDDPLSLGGIQSYSRPAKFGSEVDSMIQGTVTTV